jgi:hypothetical protein
MQARHENKNRTGVLASSIRVMHKQATGYKGVKLVLDQHVGPSSERECVRIQGSLK